MCKEEREWVPERNLVELQMVNPTVVNGILYIVFLLSLTHNVIRTSVLESQTPLDQSEREVYTVHN